MRAGQIEEKARQPGLALLPISPAFEWHSLHLPVGTDAIITEEVARRLAIRLKAVYFRALPLGLDEVRSAEFKAMQGLDPQVRVFGMNYPHLPLESEYTTADTLRSIVESRLRAIRGSGFRLAAIINHHGGCGQIPLLKEIAAAWSTPTFQVEFLQTGAFARYQPPESIQANFNVGGHAGLAETLQLMAFRPDLVDLAALPDGDLKAAQLGILHDNPEIPERFNPRHATAEDAIAWGDSVVDSMAAHLNNLLIQNVGDGGRSSAL